MEKVIKNSLQEGMGGGGGRNPDNEWSKEQNLLAK